MLELQRIQVTFKHSVFDYLMDLLPNVKDFWPNKALELQERKLVQWSTLTWKLLREVSKLPKKKSSHMYLKISSFNWLFNHKFFYLMFLNLDFPSYKTRILTLACLNRILWGLTKCDCKACWEHKVLDKILIFIILRLDVISKGNGVRQVATALQF